MPRLLTERAFSSYDVFPSMTIPLCKVLKNAFPLPLQRLIYKTEKTKVGFSKPEFLESRTVLAILVVVLVVLVILVISVVLIILIVLIILVILAVLVVLIVLVISVVLIVLAVLVVTIAIVHD